MQTEQGEYVQKLLQQLVRHPITKHCLLVPGRAINLTNEPAQADLIRDRCHIGSCFCPHNGYHCDSHWSSFSSRLVIRLEVKDKIN